MLRRVDEMYLRAMLEMRLISGPAGERDEKVQVYSLCSPKVQSSRMTVFVLKTDELGLRTKRCWHSILTEYTTGTPLGRLRWPRLHSIYKSCLSTILPQLILEVPYIISLLTKFDPFEWSHMLSTLPVPTLKVAHLLQRGIDVCYSLIGVQHLPNISVIG